MLIRYILSEKSRFILVSIMTIFFLSLVMLLSFSLAFIGIMNACLLSEVEVLEIENYDKSKK